ncbi:MAG TPA: periplasmic heavy metal sensor [Bryobacteraceae bacterium]|nr:periplasmic heavy metal sensor [Bryobacteraceae bacterium]
MRNKLITLVTLGALCATATLAQGRRPMGQRGTGTPPDPVTMVERRVEMLKRTLSLTDAQATQATAIYKNAAETVGTVHTELQAAHEALRTAIKDNNDAGIDQAAAKVGSLTGQLTAIHGKAEAAFYGILSADQRTKYDEMGPRGFGGGFGMGGGDRRGGPGMGPGSGPNH